MHFQPRRNRLASEPLLLLLFGSLPQHQVVEMQYRPTLALVAQPGLLALAPGTLAVDEVGNRGTVFLVQLLHLLQSRLHHFVVPWGVSFLIGSGIAHQGIV